MSPSFLRSGREGLLLSVLVQPKASKNEIAGLVEDRLKIRLTAPPVDGKANEALVRFLAKRLGLPRSQVSLAGGHRSRRKEILIQGLEAGRAAGLLSPG